MIRTLSIRLRILGAFAVGSCFALDAKLAHAQSRSMVGIDAEGGALFIADPMNSRLFGVGAGGGLDVEINAHPVLGIHLGGTANWFSTNGTAFSTTYFGGRAGLRLHPLAIIASIQHDLWIDVHGDYGVSAGIARPGFDAGLGFGLHVTHGLRLGPFARFQWSSDPLNNNPMFVTAGLNVEILGDPRSSVPSADTDHDGVLDREDLCPMDPMGARPDPNRRGCPARDTDGDGVIDSLDQCPSEPAGARPDPARVGCPMLDRDHDGVVDRDDHCPDLAGSPPTGCPTDDSDHDGVPDVGDQCPTTPRGEHPDPERAGCPDGDDDADGVLNHDDQCRTQPQGLRPDPARPGCPAPDRDSDLIPDATDACPDRAGAPSRNPRENGCPGLAVFRDGQIVTLRPVFFAPRLDRLLPRSRPVLLAVVEAMLASPEIERISIEGHTDDIGPDETNLELSRRRAANVMAFLVQNGVDPGRIEAHGYGESMPIVQAQTSDARSVNRRVQFRIVRFSGANVGTAPSGGATVSSGEAAASAAPAPHQPRHHRH